MRREGASNRRPTIKGPAKQARLHTPLQTKTSAANTMTELRVLQPGVLLLVSSALTAGEEQGKTSLCSRRDCVGALSAPGGGPVKAIIPGNDGMERERMAGQIGEPGMVFSA